MDAPVLGGGGGPGGAEPGGVGGECGEGLGWGVCNGRWMA